MLTGRPVNGVLGPLLGERKPYISPATSPIRSVSPMPMDSLRRLARLRASPMSASSSNGRRQASPTGGQRGRTKPTVDSTRASG